MNGQPASLAPRWSESIIAETIEALKGYLKTLPREHVGKWYTQRVHAEIRAQIKVLKTGGLSDKYDGDDVADAALWSMQWLYAEIPGLFTETDITAEEFLDEWSMLVKQIKTEKAA